MPKPASAPVPVVVAHLVFREPEPGFHDVVFPAADKAALESVSKAVSKAHGEEVGETIAEIQLIEGLHGTPGEDAWEDLALNLRYSSGEECYVKDIKEFARRGVSRA